MTECYYWYGSSFIGMFFFIDFAFFYLLKKFCTNYSIVFTLLSLKKAFCNKIEAWLQSFACRCLFTAFICIQLQFSTVRQSRWKLSWENKNEFWQNHFCLSLQRTVFKLNRFLIKYTVFGSFLLIDFLCLKSIRHKFVLYQVIMISE